METAPQPSRLARWSLGALLVGLTACNTPPKPTIVLQNGRIWTADPERPWAEALAVSGDRIVFVGSNETSYSFVNRWVNVVDLDGRMVLPGLHDLQARPQLVGLILEELCNLFDVEGEEATLEAIRTYAGPAEPGAWVIGVGWNMADFDDVDAELTCSRLDELVGRRPAAFFERSLGVAWLSTRAMEMAGIGRDDEDLAGGRIARRASGEPSGILEGTAVELAVDALPSPSAESWERALRRGIDEYNETGVTSLVAAQIAPDGAAALRALRERDELEARVALAPTFDTRRTDDAAQVAELARDSFTGDDLLCSRTVGVPVDGTLDAGDALLVDGWPDGRSGLELLAAPRLQAVVAALQARGLQAHLYAAGDGAVRNVAEALEAAPANADGVALRHVLVHAELLSSADLDRLARLGAGLAFTLAWCTPSALSHLAVPLDDERLARLQPARDADAAGLRWAGATGWGARPALSPWKSIEAGLTRRDPGDADGPRSGAQTVSLVRVLRAYTIDAAWLMHREDETGSLEVGKKADFIVLDRDLFTVPPSEIHRTEVLVTVLDGEPVHGTTNLTRMGPEEDLSLAPGHPWHRLGDFWRFKE